MALVAALGVAIQEGALAGDTELVRVASETVGRLVGHAVVIEVTAAILDFSRERGQNGGR